MAPPSVTSSANSSGEDPILGGISEPEIVETIRRTKTGKAPGPDELPPEMLKWAGEAAHPDP
eukprot:10380932-Alexandrium_andersonii.AAC.1